MHSNDIAKLNKIIKASKINFPKIKINFAILDSGEVVSCINNYCLSFENVRKFVRDLAFLINAKFTPAALKACEKKKKQKKKNIFFYYLFSCVNYNRNKARSLEDLRAEFNKLYNLEMKQGRKKRKTTENGVPGATLLRVELKNGVSVATVEGKPEKDPTECTEQGQIL